MKAIGSPQDFFAPDPGKINFRRPNWLTVLYFCILFAISQVTKQETYLGFLPHDQLIAIGSGFVAIGFSRIIRQYGERIEQFEPRSAVEAKRANEQIKSVSNLFNALAGGSAIALTAKQLSQSNPDYGLIVLTLGLSVWIHTGARNLLGLIKDESER